MGWKPAQQHGRRDMSHERENLPEQEHIPLGNNKRRNALTVCSLREDVLRQLDNLCARHTVTRVINGSGDKTKKCRDAAK